MKSRDTTGRNYDDLVAISFLFAFATLLFFDVLFLGNNFYSRDITGYAYPIKSVVREAVRSGTFPYWNPFYAAGQPLAANPAYELFYPPQWLIFLPDFNLGFRLHILIHIYLALAGMYVFLRSLKLRVLTAFFGAFTFGLCGATMSQLNLLPILFPLSWIPLILWFYKRLIERKRIADLCGVAITAGMQFLCGEPFTMLQTWFLMLLFGINAGWDQPERRYAILHNAAWAVFSVFTAALVGAMQFLPMLDHAGDSVRVLGFPYEIVSRWSFPPARLAELVYPNFFGSLERHGFFYWGDSAYPHSGGAFYYSVYAGLLVAALAAGGFAARVRGWWVSLTGVLFLLLAALGDFTPLLRILYDLGVRSLRYTEKFVIGIVIILIVFASISLDELIRGNRAVRRFSAALAVISAVVASAFFLFSLSTGYESWFVRIWDLEKSGIGAKLAQMSSVYWAAAAGRGALAAALLFFLTRLPARVSALAVTIFLVGDLGLLGNQLALRVPRRFFDAPPIVSQIPPGGGGVRLFNAAALDPKNPNNEHYFNGELAYWVYRNGLWPMTPAIWGIPSVLEYDIDETQLLPTSDFRNVAIKLRDSGRPDWANIVMAMSNAGFRLDFNDFENEKERIEASVESVNPVVVVATNPDPKYYFADQVVRFRGVGDFLRRLATEQLSRRVAFADIPSFAPAAGSVRTVEDSWGRIDLEATAEGDALLVISVTRHEYWRAWVDGAEQELIPVNVAYQALRLEAGKHSVRLRYRNPAVDLGIVISLSALVVLLAGSIIESRRSGRVAE